VQQALVDLNFDLGTSGPNHDGVDGIYGPKTAAAVRAFKREEQLGFEQFGDVGPGTMRRLDELFPAPASSPDVPSELPREAPPLDPKSTEPEEPPAPGTKAKGGGASQKSPVPTATQPLDVVLDVRDGLADVWSRQFIAAQKRTRRRVEMAPAGTAAAAVAKIKQALRLAGRGGRLIFNVGHGVAGQLPFEGNVDLAPGNALKLGGLNEKNVFVDVFYDVNIAGPPSVSQQEADRTFNAGTPGARQRSARFAVYTDLSRTIKATALSRVYFLTCRVGRSLQFLRKIANDWGTVLVAYTDQMVLDPQSNGRIRMRLKRDPPGSGTNTAASEEQLPLETEANSLRVGPPQAP
jgi:peptidoglycan hydrolase-like protein with peptidoglycan-binding domain